MEFFNQAIDILKILVMALGAGLAVWGVINLLEGYHLHTLRHFYATYLLQEGTSKQVAASLLGHADTAFLERTYCHPQDMAKQQAAKLMQDLLNNQNPCYVAFMKNKNRKAKKAG